MPVVVATAPDGVVRMMGGTGPGGVLKVSEAHSDRERQPCQDQDQEPSAVHLEARLGAGRLRLRSVSQLQRGESGRAMNVGSAVRELGRRSSDPRCEFRRGGPRPPPARVEPLEARPAAALPAVPGAESTGRSESRHEPAAELAGYRRSTWAIRPNVVHGGENERPGLRYGLHTTPTQCSPGPHGPLWIEPRAGDRGAFQRTGPRGPCDRGLGCMDGPLVRGRWRTIRAPEAAERLHAAPRSLR